MDLGQFIRDRRKAMNLTQQQLADKARLDWKYLAAIEHGRKSPSLTVLVRLMETLDVEPPELFRFSISRKIKARDATEEAIHALVRSLKTSEKRLALNLVRAVIRSRRGKGK